MAKKEFKVEIEKSEDIPMGKGGLLCVSRAKINGRDMISFSKFFLDTATGERKFPKGFAVPIDLKDKVIEAINKVCKQ